MLKRFIPLSIKRKLKAFQIQIQIKKVKNAHAHALISVRTHQPIKVAFFLVLESIWKYEHLYFLLKNDSRFQPIVFVCPFVTYGEENMQIEMKRAYDSFIQKGYEVQTTQLKNGSWLDVKESFQPDIVFFTSPWKISLNQYYIHHYLDTLSCYVPYGFNSCDLYQTHYNEDMQNFCWKYFVETDFHQQLARKYSLRKGDNTVVTGFPGIDNLMDKSYVPQQVWKPQTKLKKHIIWAPHHTLPEKDNMLDYATFLTYADLFWQLTEKFKDEVQFCFKPHPNLRVKLNKPEVWGKEKTDTYFKQWEEGENTQLNEGDYIDLFLGSDAMIHDSGSFVLEYFATEKPVMFLVNNEKSFQQFNQLGKEALQNMYLGYNQEDIIHFIEHVVVQGNDEFMLKRRKFQREVLAPGNTRLASENIYQILCEELKG
ncbi:MAG: CDP-glycerol glycerophosphotransferase family protein [Brumimicrobium sp.]|nr:CDP-glycerol glycerophosphotransferase family protein [Brumimicrobium sp.]